METHSRSFSMAFGTAAFVGGVGLIFALGTGIIVLVIKVVEFYQTYLLRV